MTIGELSRVAGVSASAIRYYEQEGLLTAASRSGGRRVFDDAAASQLIFIQVAKEAGFSLKEIRQLIGGFSGQRWRRLAERKLKELDDASRRIRLMQMLLRRLVDCGCFDVETCGTLLQRKKEAR
jgi:MerR family redox-sensitive transcriptional activator SoxR